MRRNVAAGNAAALRRLVGELTERLRRVERTVGVERGRARQAINDAAEMRRVLVEKRVLAETDFPERKSKEPK